MTATLAAHMTVVVKLGGATLDGSTVDGGGALLDEVAALARAGLRVVLVHGGGPLITSWLARLGVPTRFVDGQRATDEAALEVATMVLRGIVNTGVVAALGRLDVRAVGLSGADDRLLRARRRPELGLVGEVDGVDTTLLRALLGQGIVPVIAPLGLDRDGALLNINADLAAAALAAALGADAALFMTDVPGVRGPDGAVRARLDEAGVRQFIDDGTINGGMIPKVRACLAALRGARQAVILDGRAPGALRGLLTGAATGTVVQGARDGEQGKDAMTSTSTSTSPVTGDANAPIAHAMGDTLGGAPIHPDARPPAAPGSTAQEREARVYMRTFKREPLVLVRGEGTRVWDEDGRAYLDLVAGIAVNILGHAHPAVAGAISRQAHTLMHTSNLYYTLPQLELAELLLEATGMEGVFFTNSGAEANEAAIKMARKWGKRHKDGAYEIVTALNSFHGRTLATVAATGKPAYQAPFAPMPAGFTHVRYNSIEALEEVVGPGTAAVLLEPIQGEGGIHPAAPGYLATVRRLCDERDCLLMLDEVQSGMGRTGAFLACQGDGVVPDVVTLAKGLGGGVPLGAALARGSANVFEPGDHGSTQGGNPLACAAGVATMRALREEGLIDRAAEVGAYFAGELRGLMARGLPVTEVRGRGLMLAIETGVDAPAVVARAREGGVLVNATGPTTLRMAPPLTLTPAEVDEAVDVLERALIG